MKYLPFENITFKTILKEGEIINRLAGLIEPERIFRSGLFGSGSTKTYEGQIDELTFNIKRIIGYHNSFLPRINGTIQRDFDGTTIEIKMRMSIFVTIFIFIWCSGVGLGCVAVLSHLINYKTFHPATLIPFGMLIFMYALTVGGFKYESSKAKKDLQTLFEAEMVVQ